MICRDLRQRWCWSPPPTTDRYRLMSRSRFARFLPHAIIERVPGLGHLAHEEAPQLIAQLIVKYAQATAAEQAAQNM